ncbi:ABC transporter permease [Granulicoccus phenolivorans]|uniref:ABC transporter permease n=1 Tax=Granulicoccus phenolivorans TaxID=266854 RepID=UPI0004267AD5|nr:ABC transporter permease [Granulicoccus phenolivorans]
MSAELDFSPAPGVAPAGQRIRRTGLLETRLLLRNGEQILLALVIPILVLLGGHFLGRGLGLELRTLAPSVLAMALLSTSFTSLAISTGFDRRYGVLERLAATPLTRTGLLLSKALAVGLTVALQLVVLVGLALILGWRPATAPLPWLIAVLAAALAVLAFAAWALLLAGTLRAEATLGLANLIYLLLISAGAVILPLSAYPAALQPVLAGLPSAALGEALRNAALGQVAAWPLAVLAGWALVGILLARKGFRWMP